jgi:hypothetical protein
MTNWKLRRNADGEFAEWWLYAEKSIDSCPDGARQFIKLALLIGTDAKARVTDGTAIKLHQWAQRLPGFVTDDERKAIVFEEVSLEI